MLLRHTKKLTNRFVFLLFYHLLIIRVVVVVVVVVIVVVVVVVVIIIIIMLLISSPLASFGCAQYLVSDWMILIFITSECMISQPSYMARWIDLFVGFLINSLLFVF